VLHSFSDADGGEPLWGLARGANGSLYGVTSHFAFNAFKLDPPTGASTHWPYTVIYQFNGNSSGPLVFGPLPGYGQSLYGSASGIVFRLTPPSTAGDAWTQTILYTFPGGSLGSGPAGSLAVGAGGGLFGVTTDGGYVGGECFYVGGCGTVFSLTPPAQPGGLWSEEILHAFKPWIGEGALPAAGLVMGLAGVQYGTTGAGDGLGASGIFSLTPPVAPGVPMTETTLYDFGGVQDLPATVLPGPNGVLYGTASGGSGTYGAVFELVPPAQAGGRWTETILHSFTGGADGGVPNGLTLAPDGTLYGTTLGGGTNGVGTVFALTP
jgi:uncharacterized repeat protein (TIGR03803 family)